MSSLNINIPVPRRVTIDEAKMKMKHLLSRLAEQNKGMITDIHEVWTDFTNRFNFKAKGSIVNGILVVGHKEVSISASLPFMLSFFKGAIQRKISDEATNALNS